MTETIGNAEGKRRGCAFRNLSNDFVPPFACMMLVAPPDKRANVGASSAANIFNKATGLKAFGFEVDNEFGVYIDKCDLWGQLMQDPHRFVFNSDVTVPPGGVGYCSFGEYPVRALLSPSGLGTLRTNLWDSEFYTPVQDSWAMYGSTRIGAFKFFGKLQSRTRISWVVPNLNVFTFYSVYGQFKNTGIEIVPWTVEGDTTGVGEAHNFMRGEMYDHPGISMITPFRTPITLKIPGVYVLQYKGIANAYNPDPADTTIPYEYEIETNATKYSQLKGGGVLKKASDGYSSYWPNQAFEGSMQVVVEDTPVTVQLKQTLTEKVTSEGHWRIVWDKNKTAGEVNWFEATVNFAYPWWVWGDGPL